MKAIYQSVAILFLVLLLSSCEDYYATKNDPVTYGETYLPIYLTTNKPIYAPGESVQFEIKDDLGVDVKVRYSHLGKVIHTESLSSKSWNWTPPSQDFKGYLVDLYKVVDGKEQILESIAIDVSSTWTKFPRYGFLSSYKKMSDAEINRNIEVLNRYRINGVQFYDWMYDHHKPLAGTVSNPWMTWPDLLGRTNSYYTVDSYINAIHNRGMKAMFYNLCFGVLKNGPSEGVKEEWYIYTDNKHQNKDNHHLDAPFRSSIFLTNPANVEWQEYIGKQHKDVYSVFNFDGYHIDQLGGRGTVYDYNGQEVDLRQTYGSFVNKMKEQNPSKFHAMNAVNQFGQEETIAKSAVDFLYTEIWSPNNSYEQLANVLLNNHRYSDYKKNTVLAAYMNYDISNGFGFVNAPGILLTNSVIFAFGGSHIELGEHYLANEYFPNNNLQMKTDLRLDLINYYDFLTAYENLLRDGGKFENINVQAVDDKMNLGNWPVAEGQVAAVSKKFDDKDVIHLINFTNANSMDWGDKKGTQQEPTAIVNTSLKIETSKAVSKVWFASPNYNKGVATELKFEANGGSITVDLPYLKYWDMIVVEY